VAKCELQFRTAPVCGGAPQAFPSKAIKLGVLALSPNQFHQSPLNRREQRAEFMPPPQSDAMFTEQDPLALLQAKGGALLDAEFGTLCGPAKGAKPRGVPPQFNGIVAPMTGGDHASVQIENMGQFSPIKRDLRL
jgi:hypothetical protein